MAISAEFQAAMDLVDTETNELAEEVRKLRETISTSMTAADVATAQTFLGSLATRLDGIAKAPETPVPEEPGPTFSRRR